MFEQKGIHLWVLRFVVLLGSLMATLLVFGAGSTLNIKSSTDKPIIVAISPVSGFSPKEKRSITELMAGNFIATGLISASSKIEHFPKDFSQSHPSEDWSQKGVEYIVLLHARKISKTSYQVEALLFDTILKKEIIRFKKNFSKANYLRSVNFLSNKIFEKITGINGAFNSRIAYVLLDKKRGAVYHIFFSYLNGSGELEVLHSLSPIISLTFSPDGKNLAYVSFERDTPAVYIHNLATGKRRRVQLYQSNTSSPAFSKDGKRMAFVLSRGGHSIIYEINIQSGKVRRLTAPRGSYSIDTQPAYSQDGEKILFATDRYGANPQIAELDLKSNKVKAVTSNGSYNAAPKYLDKNQILMIRQGDDRSYSIYRYYRNLKQFSQLTLNQGVESFALSPNKDYLVYTETNSLTRSSVVKVMHIRTKRSALIAKNRPNMMLREAAWSPILE